MNSQYTEIEMHNVQIAEQETDEVQLLIGITTNKIEVKPIARFSHVIRNMFVPQLHKCIKATSQCPSLPPVELAEV